jgi:ATP-dependent helicase Lhr and Lhr-like helicase
MESPSCLAGFHPLVREWFLSTYGRPTAVQAEVWPRVAAGEHVLALAPTGSGKTLAAFLHAISRLASGELPAGALAVVYISPLKALNEDVRRNLELPLSAIAALFESRGERFPNIRVDVRSGDTPDSERRRFLSHPPAILCTTPESLAILLDSPRARPVLASTRLLVLDEIHSVAGGKRGSLLACSVGRLALLAGEFQRVALSATLRPPETAAAFVGGRRLSRDGEGRAVYSARPVSLAAPPGAKEIELSVSWPPSPGAAAPASGLPGPSGVQKAPDEGRYAAVIPAIASRIAQAGSLLVFTDSRRRAERIAFLLNEGSGPGTAYAHHGSLAKEARRLVEERFKAGELHCVVATASLELGIDVGGVGEVVLAGAPPEVSTALQRVGRSSHEVGGVSRGVVYPFHGMDLLLSAALVRGVDERAIESLVPPQNPLDILAQVLLEMSAEGPWKVDELYDAVRCFFPFETLPRASFDATVAMLAGKYAEARPGADAASDPARSRGSRLRELEPRVYLDAASGTIRAREGVRPLLYSSGGSIPDRGHFALRVADSKAAIGELDEEFVWERKVGDAFTLGAQSWRIVSIGSEAVEVLPLGASDDFIPFWHAESRFRSPEVSSRLLGLLDRLGPLSVEEGACLLEAEYHFDGEAARVASSFVASQKAVSTSVLPGSSTIALERYVDPSRKRDSVSFVLHTLRGGAINEPLGLLLAAACEESGGPAPEVLSSDDSILLVFDAASLGSDPEAALLSLLSGLSGGKRVEALLAKKIASTGLFGAQFRENAGRALLLRRGMPGKRVPLWVTRLKAKRLFDAVCDFDDFPITAETFRSCLTDSYDLPGLEELLADIASGRVALRSFRTSSPSPFARETFWRETGEHIYSGDGLSSQAKAAGGPSIVAEVLRSSRLRPRLDPQLVADFARKTKRLLPGWGPSDLFELAEWAKERVFIPVSELEELLASGGEELAAAYTRDPSAGGRLATRTLGGAGEPIVVHAERERELAADPGSLLPEWLRREGPVALSRVESLFGLSRDALCELVSRLEAEGLVATGFFVKGEEGEESDEATEIIDAENLEILLRLARKRARWAGEARPGRELFSLAARLQGLAAPGEGREGSPASSAQRRERLAGALDSLSGFMLPPELWEEEILPARVPRYEGLDLDALLEAEPRLWFGGGKGRLGFCAPASLEALGVGKAAGKEALISPNEPPLDFWGLKSRLALDSRQTALALWKAAFAGELSSFGFEAVRSGIVNRFGKELPEVGLPEAGEESASFGAQRRIPRALKEGWRRGAPVAGRWFSLESEEPQGEPDALDEAELGAERVRIVAARWGLVCRAVLAHELPCLSWSSLFPALRRMELRGELVYGRFFEGLEGPQFMSLPAFELFGRLEAARGPYWLNAMDPAVDALCAGGNVRSDASASGRLSLPIRAPGSRVAILDGRLAAVSTRNFASLEIAFPPDSIETREMAKGLAEYRQRRPGRIAIALINGEDASASAYAPSLEAVGFERDRKRMVLWQGLR